MLKVLAEVFFNIMTIALLRKLIKNNIDINEGDIFTAIIGLNPSQGADLHCYGMPYLKNMHLR